MTNLTVVATDAYERRRNLDLDTAIDAFRNSNPSAINTWVDGQVSNPPTQAEMRKLFKVLFRWLHAIDADI
jgi:transposase